MKYLLKTKGKQKKARSDKTQMQFMLKIFNKNNEKIPFVKKGREKKPLAYDWSVEVVEVKSLSKCFLKDTSVPLDKCVGKKRERENKLST